MALHCGESLAASEWRRGRGGRGDRLGTGGPRCGPPRVAPVGGARGTSLLLAFLPPRLPRVQTDLLVETMHHYECGIAIECLLLFIIIVIK